MLPPRDSSECGAVIDNGNDGIGTLLEACSSEFMGAFRSADIIISKGQANYETLVETGDERIFFLFKVKCSVVARALNREDGDIVLMRNIECRHGRDPEKCLLRSTK